MKKKLKYYGGMGYGYSPEDGNYEVKYNNEKQKQFTKLSEAKEFYESLVCGKAIWDLNGAPELIECHYI